MTQTTAEQRAEGARLLAAMTPPQWDVYDDNTSADGWLIFGPDGDGLVTCHGNPAYGYTGGPPGGDPRADAAGIAWLVNHAAALLADAAALAAREADDDAGDPPIVTPAVPSREVMVRIVGRKRVVSAKYPEVGDDGR